MRARSDRSEYLRMRRLDFVRRGMCSNCGIRPARPGLRKCERCGTKYRSLADEARVLAERRAATQERRARLGSTRMRDIPGQCCRCTDPAHPGGDLCLGHLEVMLDPEVQMMLEQAEVDDGRP